MAILNEMRMFGDIFKELRLEKGLSQDKIAIELDVSQGLITKWESHQSTPSPEMLDYIADYFDTSTDYLIGRTTDKRFYYDEQDNKILNVLYDKLKKLPEDKQKFILNVTENFIKDEKIEKKIN